MLEPVEIKKLNVFSGGGLERHESTLAEGAADAEMLEYLGLAEDDG
jgi:hypothetical protein